MSEIRLKEVGKVYGGRGGVEAVRGLDLRVRDREFLVLLGPSGCGKTSTLRMIAGLEEITSGDIYFDGVRVNDLPPGVRNIAMAFESYALYHLLTVWENIAFPLRTRRMEFAEIKRRVEWAAETLHITDTLGKRPAELSGGQKQRVSLARAIVREPAAFLLDEPLSHLDMKQKQHMRAELKRLNSDLATTMICVTHDQREALALADRIAVMNDGELRQIGTPAEIYSDPEDEFVAGFIGEPSMNLLDCRVADRDGGRWLISSDGVRLARVPPDKLARLDGVIENGLRLGIRPARMKYGVSGSAPDSVPATVYAFESLGEKGILTVRAGQQLLKLITPARERFEKEETIHVQLPWEHIYFFSTTTGERMRI